MEPKHGFTIVTFSDNTNAQFGFGAGVAGSFARTIVASSGGKTRAHMGDGGTGGPGYSCGNSQKWGLDGTEKT